MAAPSTLLAAPRSCLWVARMARAPGSLTERVQHEIAVVRRCFARLGIAVLGRRALTGGRRDHERRLLEARLALRAGLGASRPALAPRLVDRRLRRGCDRDVRGLARLERIVGRLGRPKLDVDM